MARGTHPTIVIGVDDSDRSEDAVAFGREVATALDARVVLVCAFPFDDDPSRALKPDLRRALLEDARVTLRRMARRLEGVPEELVDLRAIACPSPARALDETAGRELAELIVLGSTHTGRLGRVFPGSTAERLLHGAPCAVAVVPQGYRLARRSDGSPVGVAWDGSAESEAALDAAVRTARAVHRPLRVLEVLDGDAYATPAPTNGPGHGRLGTDAEDTCRRHLQDRVASLPPDVPAEAALLTGRPAEELAAQSATLALLYTGSRGYGPVRAVLLGGLTGALVRRVACPLVIVPRGAAAPPAELLAGTCVSSA